MKTKRQSLTSITGIDGAYRASCYINAEILPPFAPIRAAPAAFIYFSNSSGLAAAAAAFAALYAALSLPPLSPLSLLLSLSPLYAFTNFSF